MNHDWDLYVQEIQTYGLAPVAARRGWHLRRDGWFDMRTTIGRNLAHRVRALQFRDNNLNQEDSARSSLNTNESTYGGFLALNAPHQTTNQTARQQNQNMPFTSQSSGSAS